MYLNAFRACLAFALLLTFESFADAQSKSVTPTVSNWHARSLNRTAFSPDSRWLVSASSDSIKIWSVENGRMIRSFTGPDSEISELKISADGQSIAALTSRSLVIWDSETGAQRIAIKLPFGCKGLELTSSDEVLVVDTGQIHVYDTRTGKLKRKIGNEVSVVSESGYPNYATFSPDRRTLVLGYRRYRDKWLARVTARDAATGNEIAVFESHTDDVQDVAVSPDGNLVASGSADRSVRLWDLRARKLLHTWPDHKRHLERVVFSSDGKRVFAADGSDYLYVWDVTSGKQIDRIKLDRMSADGLGVSPDGKILAVTGGGRIALWDPQTLKYLRDMQGGTKDNYEQKLHVVGPDAWVSSDEFYSHRLWSVTTGQLLQNMTTKIDVLPARKRAADGSWPVVQKTGEEVSVSRSITDAPNKTFMADTLYTFRGSVSDDTRYIAGARKGDDYEIWDTQTGKRVSVFKQKDELFYPVFSPDNRTLAGVSKLPGKAGAAGLRLWNVNTGKLEKTIYTGEFLPHYVTYAPDGKSILLHSSATTLVDASSGKRRWHITQEQQYYNHAVFSPDGKTIAASEYGPRIDLLDAASGRVLRSFAGNPGDAESVLFLQNGTRLVTGNRNGTGAIWDVRSGQLLATMVIQRSGEWITITPEGFFVSSEKGAELVHVARGFDTIGVQQVYQALYRPDLVKEKLAGDPKGLVRNAAQRLDLTRVVDSGPSPEIRVNQLPASSGQPEIFVPAGIFDRGGGIGRIEWRVNGITSGIDETPAAASSGQTLNLSRNLALDPGPNVIEIVAYNRSNLVSSAPLRVTVQGPSLALPDPSRTRLFVLAAGLDNYADKKFQLTYSVRDADAVTRALAAAGKGLYQNVIVKLLKNEEVVADKLDTAFKELAKQVTASDVFVIYLAGHGKTVDGRYHFIPQTFKVSGELTLQSVDSAVKAQGISQEQWQRWFAMISAKRSVAIFDTCESGTLTGDDLSTKALEQGAASERLAQATGRSILTASAGSQEALEGYREHGLFTYHLLEALDRGDSDNNGKLEINELAAYIYSQVTTVSDRVFKRKQEPQIKLATNYSLANRFRFLDETPATYASDGEDVELKQTAQVQIRPGSGATFVRSIAPNTKVTVVKSEGGWSLISQNGAPIGYVPTAEVGRRK